MATIEDAATIDLRIYVAESTLLAEGLPGPLFKAMLKSGAVRGLYSGFRLFVAREPAREWLVENAPDVPLPKSLGKRKRVLTRVFSRKVPWSAPSETVTAASSIPTGPEAQASMAKAVETALPSAKPVKPGSTSSARAKARAKSAVGTARPTDARIRELHARLRAATTAEERRAVYEKCGHHPVALARWFRMLGLEKTGSATAKASGISGRGPGRPRKMPKETKKPSLEGRAPKEAIVARSGSRDSRGLSKGARETAMRLLRALLDE